MRPQPSKRKAKPPGGPLLSAEQRTMILPDPIAKHLRKHESIASRNDLYPNSKAAICGSFKRTIFRRRKTLHNYQVLALTQDLTWDAGGKDGRSTWSGWTDPYVTS